jgi:hypothetical protein
MIGALMSFLKNMLWLGFSLVEAIVLTLAFNYLAPVINSNYLAGVEWKLPFTHIGYWHAFALLILVHYVGLIINNLTPKFVNVTNNQSYNKDK